jgi:hypothetical protein
VSTKNKNRHGRIGIKRSTRPGVTRTSDAYTHTPTIEEEVQKLPIAHRNIIEAFSEHRYGGSTFRTKRAARTDRPSWVQKIAARIEANRAAVKASNDARNGVVHVDLSGLTVKELKVLCDDRGIDYKSKDTKATLLGYLA